VPSGGEAAAKPGDTQDRAAELKEDLAKMREDLPDVKEPATGGKGFWAALKRLFGGK
jgi:hypothetical protein